MNKRDEAPGDLPERKRGAFELNPRSLLIVALILTALYIALRLLAIPPDPREQGGRFVEAAVSGTAPVRVQTWIEKGAVTVGGAPFKISVTVQNETAHTLSDFRWVEFEIGSLDPDRTDACWGPLEKTNAVSGPRCAVDPAGTQFSGQLLPGQFVTWTSSLKPGTMAGVVAIVGVLRWKSEAPGSKSPATAADAGISTVLASAPARFAEIHVRKRYAQQVAALAEAGKDLAVPCALALFAAFFQILLKNRDERETAAQKERDDAAAAAQKERDIAAAAAQKERDDAAAAAEKRRVEAAAVHRHQLPKLHEYISKHYMPMRRSLRQFAGSVAEFQAAPATGPAKGAASQKAAFWILMFLRQCNYLRENKGGLFFKNLDAEEIAAYCIGFLLESFETFGEEEITRLIKIVEVENDSWIALKQRIHPGAAAAPKEPGAAEGKAVPSLEQDWEKFHTAFMNWLGSADTASRDEVLAAVEVVKDLLLEESNRPFQNLWYERLGHRDIGKLKGAMDKIEGRLTRTAAAEAEETIRLAIRRYLSEGIEERRRSDSFSQEKLSG